MEQLSNANTIAEHTEEQNNDILQFTKYIRHGLSNGTNLEVLRDYSMWYWRKQIRPIFFAEEQLALPYVGKHFFAEQLVKEHEDIRALVLILDKNPESSLFSILATFIEYHVQFKNRFFPKFLSAISFDQHNMIPEYKSSDSTVSASDWKSAFWTKK